MIFYLVAVIVLIAACDKSSETDPPLTDIDGNKYDTVQISSQFWMQQNLKTSHYRNGDPIPEITDMNQWSTATSGAWCWYNNDSVKYAAVYGKLYNWYAVKDPRGLAPEGWHIPNDVEWTTLSQFLGGDVYAGGEMKETGTSHWATPNTGANNSTGFTGRPGGYRGIEGSFLDIGVIGLWWGATDFIPDLAFCVNMNSTDAQLPHYFRNFRFGFSVRCLRD